MNGFTILADAIKYIENNLFENFKRSDVAEYCHVSLSYLEKIFKYIFNRGIKTYILKRRMTEAAKDLVENEMSVTDVSMKYQYGSVEAFSRAFKSVWYENPSDYRKKSKFTGLFLKINSPKNTIRPKEVDITKLYELLHSLKDTYILCFDAVKFQKFNDISYKLGDRAILEIAKRLEKYTNDDMFVLRIGGDEFAIITNSKDYYYVKGISDEVLSHNGDTFSYEGNEYPLSLYCGISLLNDNLEYSELFDSMQNVIDESKAGGNQ